MIQCCVASAPLWLAVVDLHPGGDSREHPHPNPLPEGEGTLARERACDTEDVNDEDNKEEDNEEEHPHPNPLPEGEGTLAEDFRSRSERTTGVGGANNRAIGG